MFFPSQHLIWEKSMRPILVAIVLIAACGCAVNDQSVTQLPAATTAQVLIAAEQSEFKDAVVAKVTAALSAGNCTWRVAGLDALAEAHPEAHQAVVIINEVWAWRLRGAVRDFLNRIPNDQRGKIILVSTAGRESWQAEVSGIDAITTASTAPQQQEVADYIIGQVNLRLAGRQPLDLATAAPLIRGCAMAQNPPSIGPEQDLELQEITPPGAWSKLGVQLYRIKDNDGYLIRDGKVYLIGIGFGGRGILAGPTFLADLPEYQSQLLCWHYQWGSGISRTEAGFGFRDGATWRAFAITANTANIQLAPAADGHGITVTIAANPLTRKDGACATGKLNFSRQPDGALSCSFSWEPNAPADLTAGVTLTEIPPWSPPPTP